MVLKDIYLEFEKLKQNPKVKTEVFGKSTLGYELLSFKIGNNKNKVVMVEGGLHAREWITTLLCIELIKFYATKKLDFEICFVPLVNPDGVGLCLEGIDFVKQRQEIQEKLKKINNGSEDFSLWKANINAVDLNVNFDALWGEGQHNVFEPAPANFVGTHPESEVEVVALKNLALEKKPYISLCFHSKGEVIFYGFDLLSKQQIKRDLFIAKQLKKISGYKPVKTKKSVGGFSDWVGYEMGCPALTIEVGNDKISHPITKQHLEEIFNQTKHTILYAVYSYDKFLKKSRKD